MARGILLLFVLVAIGVGGLSHFAQVFQLLLFGVLGLLILALVAAIAYLAIAHYRGKRRISYLIQAPVHSAAPPPQVGQPATSIDQAWDAVPTVWSVQAIRARLDEIDWYQFEKFCAALLKADRFTVERRGGAQPDGGVDLLVVKDGGRALIQCKHWRTWKVQERTVREMLGSMTAMKVRQGAIYTLAGWTEPAAEFAAKHDITLANGDELAASAALQLTPAQLGQLLDTSVHHCPKCESKMVLRTGAFTPFWGCSRYRNAGILWLRSVCLCSWIARSVGA